MMIDPATEEWLKTIKSTNRWIAAHNIAVVFAAGGALACASVYDSWLCAFLALVMLGATRSFIVAPQLVKKPADPRSMRRVN